MDKSQDQAGNSWPKWLMAGDCAVILEFGDLVNQEINSEVHAWAEVISGAEINGLLEVVPTFRSLSIYFDPLITDHEYIMGACEQLKVETSSRPDSANTWHIPVCYDAAFGLDLKETANVLSISTEELIRKHSQSNFRVYVLGFMPGFSFLGGMDPDLNLPRRTNPRTLVPKGSVAIAMGLGGVYPFASPGGWHILGRTPTHLYDAERTLPIFFAPGDAVKFVPVDRRAFDALEKSGGTSLAQLREGEDFWPG